MQTGANNRVVFTPHGATVAHADTGAGADLTLRGLPTTGDRGHVVNGILTAADIGPRTTGAAVNGNTLTVDFDEPLNTSVNTGELRWDLGVRGAGTLNAGNRNADMHPDSVAVSNPTATTGRLTLTLGVAARPGETVTLSYTGSLLRGSGANGKKAPMFRDLAVTNNTPGSAGPKPVRAVAAGNKLLVVFDGDLTAPGGNVAGSAFAVRTSDADGDGRLIRGTGNAQVRGAGRRGDAGRGGARRRSGHRVLHEARHRVPGAGQRPTAPRGAVRSTASGSRR